MPADRTRNAELLIKYRAGHEGSLDELVQNNLPLVRSVASRFFSRDDPDDIMQVGALGLIKAIRNFDPARGTELSTYAVPVIAGEIKRYLRDSGSVKAGRRTRELSVKIGRLMSEAEKTGECLKISGIADKLGISEEEAADAAALLIPMEYLDEKLPGDSETSLSDTIASKNGTEDEAVGRVLSKQLLDKLQGQEKDVIIMRYFMELTQSETAERLGLTQPKVSRLEAGIIVKLRSFIKA